MPIRPRQDVANPVLQTPFRIRDWTLGWAFPPLRPADDEHKTRLLQADLLANLLPMSTVELAVRKVKKLSARQARELLGWLAARQANGTSLKQPSRTLRRNTTARRSMQKLTAWPVSVRFTPDWQPPRMPDDLVQPVRL